jgi:hypothetical protein
MFTLRCPRPIAGVRTAVLAWPAALVAIELTRPVVVALVASIDRAAGATRFRLLVESGAGVLVFAARTPVAIALVGEAARVPAGPLRLFGRVPQFAPGEVTQRHIRVLAAQLVERRQELFPFLRAERGRLSVDQDRPVRVAWGHNGRVTLKSTIA